MIESHLYKFEFLARILRELVEQVVKRYTHIKQLAEKGMQKKKEKICEGENKMAPSIAKFLYSKLL